MAIGGLLAALAAGATLLGVRDTLARAPPALTGRLDLGGLTPYLVIGFAMVLGFGALQPTTAFYVQDRFVLGTAAAIRAASYASACFAAVAFALQAFVVRALPVRPLGMLRIGLAISALAIGGALASPTLGWLVLAFGLLGAGYGLAQSGLMAAVSVVGAERQGHAAGRLHAVMSAAWIVGALGGTALYGVAIAAPLVLAAVAMGLAFLRCASRSVDGSGPGLR